MTMRLLCSIQARGLTIIGVVLSCPSLELEGIIPVHWGRFYAATRDCSLYVSASVSTVSHVEAHNLIVRLQDAIPSVVVAKSIFGMPRWLGN